MSGPFTHQPLADPTSSIRLLKLDEPLLGGSGNANPVRFKLIDTPLASAPEYWALSYAWGDEPPTHPAYCNGQSLEIAPNCADALRQLASEPKSRKHYLWVDTICIDQSSVAERNHQVSLMADIYSRAAHVIVWLGLGTDDSAQNMDELNELATLAHFSPAKVSERYRRATESATAASRAALPPGGDRFFTLFPPHILEDNDPFRAVCRAAWHHRLWTLQEVVLARRATIRAGNRELKWERLARVAGVVAAESAVLGFTRYPGDGLMRVRIVSALQGLLREKKVPEQRYRLPKGHPLGKIEARVPREMDVGFASHFMMACALLASDKRDKVYGQLAMLQRHGAKMPQPDYNRPLHEIFRETARAIIEHKSSLELLLYVSSGKSHPELPSWVPDFGFTWFPWIPASEFAAAAGSSKAQYRFDEKGNLFLRAQRVDRILRKTETLRFIPEILEAGTLSSEATMEVIRQLQKMVRWALYTNFGCGMMREELCMVLMQEIALTCRPDKEQWRKLVKQVEIWSDIVLQDIYFPPSSADIIADPDGQVAEQPGETVHKWSESEPQLPAPTSPVADRPPSSPRLTTPELTDKSIEAEDMEPGAEDADELIDPIAPLVSLIGYLDNDPASTVIQHMAIMRLDGNSFFFTEGGRLGVATSEIQENDAVYLVPGMSLPMVVREVEGGHQLIGCPFLDGVMSGELWRKGEGLVELRIL